MPSQKLFNSMFHLATDSIFRSLKKMDPNVSISLLDVKYLEREPSTQERFTFNNFTTIRNVPDVMPELKLLPHSDSSGFVTEFSGQKAGMVVSYIKDEDLETLFEDEVNPKSATLEFFNILNMKIISQLINMFDISLKCEPTRLLTEKDVESVFGLLVQIKYDITEKDNSKIIETNLCFKTPLKVYS